MNTLIVATLLTVNAGALPPYEVGLNTPVQTVLMPVEDELLHENHVMTAGDCNPRVKVCEE